MKHLIRRAVLHALFLLLPTLTWAQLQVPEPRYTPPDPQAEGFEAYYRDMVVISTDCRTWEQADALWRALTDNGALVSVISSPGRMLAWVPAEARARVLATRLDAAQGGAGVTGLASTPEELTASASNTFLAAADNDADRGLAGFLSDIRTVPTAEFRRQMEEKAFEFQTMRDVLPREDPPRYVAMPDQGGKGASMLWTPHATRAYGKMVNTSFFMESKSGTGSWNWDNTMYNKYRTYYINAMNFWTGTASRYGKTLTFVWINYAPSDPMAQVTGEPVTVGENTFIPQILDRILPSNPPDFGLDAGLEWSWWYNRVMRTAHAADESIIGFIAYKPAPPEGIWPHAVSATWNSGEIEGCYFTLDIQYWQARPDPLLLPYRNVIAHETGHLFGLPDEYNSGLADCNWDYRGLKNINCQRTQACYGRPGYQMTGYDGIMDMNYIGGTSCATPVHSGLQNVANIVLPRIVRTQPENITVNVAQCDGNPRAYSSTIALPVSFDLCMEMSVPSKTVKSGTTYYFDHWEFKRKTGSTITLSDLGPTLTKWNINAYSSLANPLAEIKAVFTSTPPDFLSVNNSLSAWLAPLSHDSIPGRGVALRWLSKYDMTKVETRVEYDRGGTWVELTGAHFYGMGAFTVDAGQWTGVRIQQLPTASGIQFVQPGATYRFRIVGYFNGNRGTPSAVAQVTTRPAAPSDTAFCHDRNEPNSHASPRTLPSIGPGIDPYVIHAGLTISNITGEFSWHNPKADVYRITAIGLSTGGGGHRLKLRLSVDSGSLFKPVLKAQRVGTGTWVTAGYVASTEEYQLSLGDDGEYLVAVEPDIFAAWTMYDLVDHTTGNFGFGEYTMSVSREKGALNIADLGLNRVRLRVVTPVPGLLFSEPELPPNLVLPNRPGWDPRNPLHLDIEHVPPPGYRFIGFDGDLFTGQDNPLPVDIGMNTPEGEHRLRPVLERLPSSIRELLTLNPKGPGGPHAVRTAGAIGSTVQASAEAPAGYDFVGWGGDTTAVTNPLPVVLWKNRLVIAYFRPKPCTPEQMSAWRHGITVTNTRQATVALEYAMQPGAGDALEAGQVDLPPVPPVGTWDVRWINIPGSQGSITDHRAVKSFHIYQGRVQTATGTTPVVLSWAAPPLGSSFKWQLTIPGVTASPIDMHTTTSYAVPATSFTFTVEVREPSCPPPTKPPRLVVTPVRVDPSEFPCINLELLLKNRATGETQPFANPFGLLAYEKMGDGSVMPARITAMSQLDSTLLLTICSGREDKDPTRRIIVVQDEHDPDTQKDTTEVDVDVPVQELYRITRKNANDWELMSLPVSMDNAFTGGLFPDPSTKVYAFDPAAGAYVSPSSLSFGTGYWLHTGSSSTLFVGGEVTSYTHSGLSGIGQPYGYGWNLIGAISHALPKANLAVTPAAGLKSIFGWNPGTGYVVPATIEPAQGYWVRVDPATTIGMSATGVAGGGATQYEKTAGRIAVVGALDLTLDDATRRLQIARDGLDASDADVLALPAPPPAPTLDARAGNGTMYLEPGSNLLRVQGTGQLRIALRADAGVLATCTLEDGQGLVLHRFDAVKSECSIPVDGQRTFLLRVEHSGSLPSAFSLEANYPNPFRAGQSTVIAYAVDGTGETRLDVYDMLGRHVRALQRQNLQPGRYLATWDGVDDRGMQLPTGTYSLRLTSAGRSLTRTLSIVR